MQIKESTFPLRNLSRETRKNRLLPIRIKIQLLRRGTKMIRNLPKKLRLNTPLIRGSGAVKYGMLNVDRLIGEFVRFDHAQSADHSNDQSAFCLLRVFVDLDLAAFNGRIFVFVAGSAFEY